MGTTVIPERFASALIVGATGINVLRTVSAFERRGIVTLRTDDIASACERMVLEMPHVVLVLVPPNNAAERDALTDRALAVGALVVELDPHADDTTFQQVLERTVHSALERTLMREEADPLARTTVVTTPPIDLDDGWDD